MPSLLEALNYQNHNTTVVDSKKAVTDESDESRSAKIASSIAAAKEALLAAKKLSERKAAAAKGNSKSKSSKDSDQSNLLSSKSLKTSTNKTKTALAKKTSKKGPLEVFSSRKAYDVTGLMLKRKNGNSDKDGNERSKNVIGDPRFSDFCGSLDVHAVSRNYGFLDEYRENEKIELLKEKKRLESKKNTNKAEELKKELIKLSDQEKSRIRLGQEADMKRKLVNQQKENLINSDGKKKIYHFSDAKIRKEVRKVNESKLGKKAKEKKDSNRERRQAAKEKVGMVKRKV